LWEPIAFYFVHMLQLCTTLKAKTANTNALATVYKGNMHMA